MFVNANALNLPIASNTVQTIVTSPPYFGLRDYGTARWIGGDPECDHSPARKNGYSTSTITGGQSTSGHQREGYRGICAKCGAAREDQQIGLELTLDDYVNNLVSVFRECWRVLKDDGVLWLNLGDSYNGNKVPGLSPKNLLGVPWLVAHALQMDGWILRRDVVWYKLNAMPESVSDRPSCAHEYVFIMTKNEQYFWDKTAVQERAVNGDPNKPRGSKANKDKPNSGRRKQDELGKPTYTGFNARWKAIDEALTTRNIRDVWLISSQPTPFAHFATMPERLVEPCILAGSRPGDLVLDPFTGSGTVAKVAIRLGRQFVGTELNYKYIHDIVPQRMKNIQMVLA